MLGSPFPIELTEPRPVGGDRLSPGVLALSLSDLDALTLSLFELLTLFLFTFLSALDLAVIVPYVVVKKNKHSHGNYDKISKKAPAIWNVAK